MDVQVAAGRLAFLFYYRPDGALFQVIPEESFAQHGEKNRIFFYGSVQSLLKGFGYYVLVKLTVEAEHPGIPFAAGRRKDLGRII